MLFIVAWNNVYDNLNFLSKTWLDKAYFSCLSVAFILSEFYFKVDIKIIQQLHQITVPALSIFSLNKN